MKFTPAFLALVPLVYAIPAPEPALSARAQGAVFVCGNAPFVQPCTKFRGASGECVNFSAAFNDNISSVGPDAGQECFFFIDGGCSGASFGPIRSPGIANIATNPSTAGFNDQLSSFRCFFG
ncbi:hypothetical protein FB451DRAFT_1398648 [Mycena latifolia]|nr:hypothetical protein FB451DRAFT_1398648 [Mycena latifolia]